MASDCTMNLEFWQAVSVWMSGKKLEPYCIRGYEVILIGRIAKIIAFGAAFPIVIDLIGEDRISNQQKWLEEKRNVLNASLTNVLLNRVRDRFKENLNTKLPLRFIVAEAIALSIAIPYFINRIFHLGGVWWWLIEYIIGAAAIFIVILRARFILRVIVMLLALPAELAYAILVLGAYFLSKLLSGIIYTIAGILYLTVSILTSPYLCFSIRAVSVFLLVVGFLLDLLASS